MLIDSHCHIDCIDLNAHHQGDIALLMEDAKAHDVAYMLCVAIEPQYQPRIEALASQFSNVFISAGVHPNTELSEELSVDELIKMSQSPSCIAIGETGLDYYRSTGDLDWQRQRLITHIKAAKQTNKPLIIHMRDAHEDTLRILKEQGAESPGAVMHCFAEDWSVAKVALDLGFYISLSGIVTFKNAQALKEVAQKTPIDRLLVETDSPYLAPVPYRGKINQPAWVSYVAKYIAELRGESFTSIADKTTENFFSLFTQAKKLA